MCIYIYIHIAFASKIGVLRNRNKVKILLKGKFPNGSLSRLFIKVYCTFIVEYSPELMFKNKDQLGLNTTQQKNIIFMLLYEHILKGHFGSLSWPIWIGLCITKNLYWFLHFSKVVSIFLK